MSDVCESADDFFINKDETLDAVTDKFKDVQDYVKDAEDSLIDATDDLLDLSNQLVNYKPEFNSEALDEIEVNALELVKVDYPFEAKKPEELPDLVINGALDEFTETLQDITIVNIEIPTFPDPPELPTADYGVTDVDPFDGTAPTVIRPTMPIAPTVYVPDRITVPAAFSENAPELDTITLPEVPEPRTLDPFSPPEPGEVTKPEVNIAKVEITTEKPLVEQVNEVDLTVVAPTAPEPPVITPPQEPTPGTITPPTLETAEKPTLETVKTFEVSIDSPRLNRLILN